MSSHTQDEISETWDQIKGGADTEAVIVWDESLKQVFTIHTIAPYGDHHESSPNVLYTGERESEESRSGEWYQIETI
jgi:hypothetical protein